MVYMVCTVKTAGKRDSYGSPNYHTLCRLLDGLPSLYRSWKQYAIYYVAIWVYGWLVCIQAYEWRTTVRLAAGLLDTGLCSFGDRVS